MAGNSTPWTLINYLNSSSWVDFACIGIDSLSNTPWDSSLSSWHVPQTGHPGPLVECVKSACPDHSGSVSPISALFEYHPPTHLYLDYQLTYIGTSQGGCH